MEVIRIPATGTPGQAGSQPGQYPPRLSEAPMGKNGEHGMSATSPKPGTAGQNIHIRLHYLDSDPGIVQAAGEADRTGQSWRVPHHQQLLLDCKGGDGGEGGRGQDGQQGGPGRNGRDATRYRDAEQGGTGGRGGDGGAGSNGADGGNAGNVFITVGEDDLDLLISCRWDTSGGRGGASGAHGVQGNGGDGGLGGAGCYWTERIGDRTYHHERAKGARGNQGASGVQPSTYLMGGKSGKEGSTQIRVLKKDLTEGTYAGTYDLEVVSFDVLDENDDGINEPGEHLLVRNIKVKNKGIMPSPGPSVPIRILIQGTHWLDPVDSEPVEVPSYIQPGATVEVPGTIRALIRNETSHRAPGEPLKVQEQVSLIATFYKRLNRALPGFCGQTTIDIQYPIQLLAPHSLDCVQKGDRVRFYWSLVNVSRKSYGMQGITGRYAATRFVDPGKVFDLPYADEESDEKHEAVDEIEEIQPGEEVPIDQDFMVSSGAMEFSDAELQVQLLLADPHLKDANGRAKLRPVMMWNLHMQISGAYKYDPLSRFLIVVNSKTPNPAIHQVIRFIRNELHLGLDIFNLSLSGSYTDNTTGQSVLPRYHGKSILIWGNSFPYFGRGQRNPWQLLDQYQVCSLIKGGTGISFIAVDNEAGLRDWARHAIYSTELDKTEEQQSQSRALPELVKHFQDQDQAQHSFDVTMETFTAKRSFVDSLGSCFMAQSADKYAQKAAKKLDSSLPLRRFMAVPMDGSGDVKKPNIGLIEGLPKTSVFLATTATTGQAENASLMDYHKYLILKSLPFSDRSRMIWNALGRSQVNADGDVWFPSAAVYRNSQWHPTQGQVWDNTFVHSKIIKYIALGIQNDIGSEIVNYLAGKVSSADSIKQLPLLNQFLTNGGDADGVQHLHDQEVELLVGTLGAILGALYNIGLGQWISNVLIPISRKRKLRNQTASKVAEILKIKYDSTLASTLQKAVIEGAKATKKDIKASGTKQLSPVTSRKLVDLTAVNTPILDLNTISSSSIAVSRLAFDALHGDHVQRETIRSDDKKHATAKLTKLVNPDEE